MMLQRQKLVVGNWKMHGSRSDNAALVHAILEGLPRELRCKVAVCAPFPYLAQMQQLLDARALTWGSQDVSAEQGGAFTGQVSAAMLADFACQYVIVGHSERRGQCGETSELVARKALRVLAAGMTPIVCVGETLAQREAGRTRAQVAEQLAAVLESVDAAALDKLVLAYEPVWAIGTGKTATAEQAQQVHGWLREQVSERHEQAGRTMPIIYGGSVKAANAGQLFAMPDIDGGLIGGAALVAGEFLGIVSAANA